MIVVTHDLGHDPRAEPSGCVDAVLFQLAGSAPENRGLLEHGVVALTELERLWHTAEGHELELREQLAEARRFAREYYQAWRDEIFCHDELPHEAWLPAWLTDEDAHADRFAVLDAFITAFEAEHGPLTDVDVDAARRRLHSTAADRTGRQRPKTGAGELERLWHTAGPPTAGRAPKAERRTPGGTRTPLPHLRACRRGARGWAAAWLGCAHAASTAGSQASDRPLRSADGACD